MSCTGWRAAIVMLAAMVGSLQSQPIAAVRRVNVPYLGAPGSDFVPAIFWFGEVESVTNYADVRVWYYDQQLEVVLHIPDRELWYDPSSNQSQSQLISSDAVSLFLDLAGNTSQTPTSTSYWFVKQLSSVKAVFRGTGSDWVNDTTPFVATDGWRGIGGPNNPEWDMGWEVTFQIPFSSVGLSGPPAQGTLWGLGVTVHDRDDQAGTPIPDQLWPENLDRFRPSTWGQLRFGRPVHTPPTSATGTTVVRHGLNGAVVRDAAVGGHTVCGGAMNAWTEWGNANYAGYTQFNIQNQWDVSDFMCFSKYYVTFPLTSLPLESSIVSAKVTLHLFGNAGFNPGDATPSAINALTVAEDWVESTITWNNAPYAAENVSVTWVYPVSAAHPAGPYEWDVTYAVAEARRQGQPLRLAFYSTDGDYHSGKYFYTSDSTDWNGTIRPSLTVEWGPSAGSPPAAPTGLKVVP